MDDWYSTIPTQPHFHKLKYIHLNSEYIFRELNSRGKYDICMLCGACQGLIGMPLKIIHLIIYFICLILSFYSNHKDGNSEVTPNEKLYIDAC